VIFSGNICTHGDLGVSGGSYSGFWLARDTKPDDGNCRNMSFLKKSLFS
jgi:hypothetical protein